MDRVDKFLLIQSWLLIGFSSWAFGGRVSWAPQWIASIAAVSMLPLALRLSVLWRYDRRRLLLLAIGVAPLLVLGGAIAWSTTNPSHAYISQGEGSGSYAFIHYKEGWPTTPVPARTWQFLTLYGALIFQGVALYVVPQRRRFFRWLLLGVFLNSLLLTLVGYGFKGVGSDQILGFKTSSNATFFATFIYRNHWAAYAILSVVSGLALFFYHFRRSGFEVGRSSPAVFFLVMSVIMAISVPVVGSRSGMIVLAVLIIVWMVSTVRILLQRRSEWGQRMKRLMMLSPIIGLIAFVLLAMKLAGPLLSQRLEETRHIVENDWRSYDRIERTLWCWEMHQVNPVWGWGLGSYPVVYRIWDPEAAADVEFAHNDWAQLLVEVGWAGVALLLVVPSWLLFRYWAVLRRSVFSNWCLIGCLALALYALMDFPFGNPACALLFIVLFATTIRYAELESQVRAFAAENE